MKVIKENKWWTFNCRNCKSQLEAGPEDVQEYELSDYDSSELYYYVECPLCGQHNIVPERKLTDKIIAMAAKKKSRKEKP